MTRERNQKRGGCGTYLVIIAVFAVIVAVSNIFLFHIMHSNRTDINPASFEHINGNNAPATDMMSGFVMKDENKTKKKTIEKKSEYNDELESNSIKDVGDEKLHKVAGLSCADHGGPSDEIAKEMVFWSDIEADQDYKSPFYDEDKYVTFEPDHGGFNNIRMAMETVLVLAHTMGRTLVLPPKKNMYLLGKGEKHQNQFSFNDFFHLDAIALEHQGLNIITMEEFLQRKGITGELKSIASGEVIKPPGDQTDWSVRHQDPLWRYLEKVGKFPEGWEPTSCVAAFPSSDNPKDVQDLQDTMESILKEGRLPDPGKGDFDGKPTPVDAPMRDRLLEMLATRKKLCIYDNELQKEELIHFKIDNAVKARMLTHFYAFIFFQDWKQDLWSKRFVRDHIRYIDEIVCAAARIVNAVREEAKSISPQNKKGIYNSFHIRRGDFQYKKVKIPAEEIYKQSKEKLDENVLLYIATDERDKSFFGPLKEHYHIAYLDDYMHLIEGINPNYYGMLDQLVAYKGEVFFGTWFSTLTGYINRMRGYYNAKFKEEGFDYGVINSYYFVPRDKKDQMREYRAVKLPIYMREFPVSWRDIDKGIGQLK